VTGTRIAWIIPLNDLVDASSNKHMELASASEDTSIRVDVHEETPACDSGTYPAFLSVYWLLAFLLN
jgi:hypothetical protein